MEGIMEQTQKWLGFSARADLLMATGRHIIKTGKPLSMPGLMIPVFCYNGYITDEAYFLLFLCTKYRKIDYTKHKLQDGV